MPLEFSAAMIRQMRQVYPAIYAAFNNDDPFSESYKDIRWRRLRLAIPEYDIVFSFRSRNIRQYKDAGANQVELWEPFYSPWIHNWTTEQNVVPNGEFNILFAMHAENDERRDALLALVNDGFKVNIHSWNWSRVFGKKDAEKLGVKLPIWEKNYARVIRESSATLCFFSKQNNDELTSRVFEIPACGGLLLAWRTHRLKEKFKDREEAFFFSSAGELLEIVRELSRNPKLVRDTKVRGHERLLNSRHSVVDRCADAVDVFKRLM